MINIITHIFNYFKILVPVIVFITCRESQERWKLAGSNFWICSKNPFSFYNSFKHQLNIWLSLQCFLFWNIFSIILFSGIFCCNRTKICFVLRQFFHSQTLASHQQKWHLRLVLRYFPFSEKFAFSFLLFALYFLLLHCLLKMALLLASQSWLFL